MNEQTDWQKLHFDSVLVDLHAHPSFNVSLFHRALTSRIYPSGRAFDPFSVRTNFPRLQEGGVDAMLSVIHAPEKGILDECPPLRLMRYIMPRTWRDVYTRPYFDVAMQMMDEIEKEVDHARDPQTGRQLICFAHSAQELAGILGQGEDRPIAMIHCLEGAHCLDGKMENLEKLFQRGAAYMVLAHFFENEVVHPCYPWPEAIQKFNWFQGERNIWLGLKPFGEDVVERMVELGMMVDVSHSTPPARARVYDIVGKRAPILASHVGVHEINPDPYNLKDWEIKRIAESGGLVGVIFMNYWLMPRESHRGLNFILRTIDHIVNVAGIDHVGLGSDFDGFTDPPDDLKDASQLPRLTQRLLASGYRPEDIQKILGGNALRVLMDGWKR
jgi:microsomal dipeptidase-like Zn-dependent dipeptidase